MIDHMSIHVADSAASRKFYLAALRPLPILATIGTRSAPARWAAAEVLRRWADAELVEVPGAGNAVQLDAPAAFAELITTWQTVSTEGAP